MIGLEVVGRRVYFTGNTYAVKDKLKNAGAHWDGERKQWYAGTAKRQLATDLVARLNMEQQTAAQKEKEEGISPDAEVIIGRAFMPTADGQLHSYYLLVAGERDGKSYFKLCFRDGSKVFWAKDASTVRVAKRYQQPTSINALKRFAERAKKAEAAGHPVLGRDGCYECGECGERVVPDGTSCWETGAPH